ncbi:MAG: hypothetical protein GY856_25950 [bacterium]|nr:hypothetical protein [bacterium]
MLREEPILFDLDGENERSTFLISNDRWTILFFSHHEEERRLIRELQVQCAPLLYIWVYDSDVWGYDLFDQQGFATSFNSDPRTHQSFLDETFGSAARPRADPETVCRLLQLALDPAQLGRIERRKSAFKEEICRRFCRLIGIEAAVSSYDDLESGAIDGLEGWQSEQLLFRLDFETMSGQIDLSGHSLMMRQTQVGLVPYRPLELPPELLAEMERMRRRVQLNVRLLRPVSWIARTWRRVYEASSRLGRPRDLGATVRRPAEPPAAPPNFRLEGRILVNDRHHCRMTLVEGAQPLSVSGKPASVFGFRIGETQVTCTARRLSKIDEVLRAPSRSRVSRDETYPVAGLSARYLLFELPPGFVAGSKDPSFLGLYIIQTVKALYVFLYRYRSPLGTAAEQAIRNTVDSFRLVD